YTEPVSMRTTRTLLDVIRNYPENPVGSRRWDERIFHPDLNGGVDRPISSLWKAPPAYVEQILGSVRLLENATVQRAMKRLFRRGRVTDMAREAVVEVLAGDAASEGVSSEALT